MRLLKDSGEEALAAEEFAKEIVRAGNSVSLSGAVLYERIFLAVLRRQVTTHL